MRTRSCLAVLLVLALAGCRSTAQSAPPADDAASRAAETARLTAYLDAEYEKELAMSPMSLTMQGRKEHYDQLDDHSAAAEERVLAWRRTSVAGMKTAFAYDRLDDDGKTSFDIWSQELDRAERSHAFSDHGYVFILGGPHVGLPQFLINFHRVDDRRDMDAYISRTSQVGRAIDQLTARAQAASAKGIRPPRFAFEQARREARSIITGAPFGPGADSALLADARTKLAALETAGKIDSATAAALTARVASALVSDVTPAYERLIAWLDSDGAKASVVPQGVSALPDGAPITTPHSRCRPPPR